MAIDASGEVAGLADPKFRGVAELGKKLGDDESTQFCMTLQWLRFALGRLEGASDLCTIDKLTEQFKANGLSLRELVVQLVQSDAFRYRRLVTPDPGQGG